MKRISLVIFALIMVVSMCACGKTPVENVTEENITVNTSAAHESDSGKYDNTETIKFSADVIESITDTQDSFIKIIEEDMQGKYVDAVKNNDGSIDFVVTPEQKQEWLDNLNQLMQRKADKMPEVNKKFYAEASEDYQTVRVALDKTVDSLTTAAGFPIGITDVNMKTFTIYGRMIMLCKIGQVINGNQDPAVNLIMMNADTGKKVVEGRGNISWGNNDWAESYQITDEEAAAIRQKAGTCSEITIEPVCFDAITIIDILSKAGGNDYKYLFINDSGNVVLGVTAEQKETMCKNVKQYIADTSEEFKDLRDGYDVDILGNFSKVHMHFNSELDEYDQEMYVKYFAIACILVQALENEETMPSVQVYIYNSDTGETVFTGNLADGITFKME